MRLQRTISREITFKGVGIHSGREVTMRLVPAKRESGIVFHRTDVDEYIPAMVGAVSDTTLATTLSNGRAEVRTVEHILATLSGMGIDNLLIELDAPEVPIMDGSAARFVEGIMDAGVARQSSPRPYLKIIDTVHFVDGQTEIIAEPSDGRVISYRMDFDHPALGAQELTVELINGNFAHDIAPARTFGFLRDVQYLQSRGLALGGSLDNAVILDEQGVMNPSGLRFRDEMIRHKALDFIGDISLCGFPIYGHFTVTRSGHTTNTRFIRHLMENSGAWRMVADMEASLGAIA